MPVSIKIEGTEKVNALFARIAKNLKNDTPVMNKIGVMGEKDVIMHFNQSKGPNGSWAPLKNPRLRGGTKPLMDTGVLRNSTGSRAKNHVAEVYNTASYAGVHNDGRNVPARSAKKGKPMVFFTSSGWIATYSAKGFKMPQRKFLWISPMTRFNMLKEYLRFAIWG